MHRIDKQNILLAHNQAHHAKTSRTRMFFTVAGIVLPLEGE